MPGLDASIFFAKLLEEMDCRVNPRDRLSDRSPGNDEVVFPFEPFRL